MGQLVNLEFSKTYILCHYCICIFYFIIVGFNDENIGCVKFGLITDDTDLEELIGLVCSVGKEIEESSKVSTVHSITMLVIFPCTI